MKTKLIVLLLVLSVVLFSGCTGNEQTSQEENATSEENVTPEENVTSTVTETEENVTVEENETEVNETEVNETEVNETEVNETEVNETEVNETEDSETEVKTETDSSYERIYTIRLDNYKASASNLEINEGETVAWLNYQDSPRRVFTLVSEQNLFENTSLSYRHSFAYTFNETGAYNFTVVGQPRMSVNVTVSES